MRFNIHRELKNGWEQFSLSDSVNGLTAIIIPEAGAILNSFGVNSATEFIEVIDGYKSKDEWINSVTTGYKSAKLSPFVCRIINASYTWLGKTYNIEKSVSNGNALHGLLFDSEYRISDQVMCEDFAEIHMIYEYGGSDPGYPFSYDSLIRYKLCKDGRLSVFTAIHNRSGVSIPVADGWHPYFSFNKPVDELRLTIKATQAFEYNSNLVPTGITVDDYRWKNGRLIGKTPIDNGYILDIIADQPLCLLSDPVSNISIEIMPSHSYPFLQVYIPGHRKSIALEPVSAPPDAFNNGISVITLAPDHTASFQVDYRLNTTASDFKI